VTDTRGRIADQIERDPGIHHSELLRRLSLAPGQLQYHLHRLHSTSTIERHPVYGRTHYFPRGYDEQDRTVLALLRRETARDIVIHLLDHGETAPSDVAEHLGIARSTLEYHLDRLVEHNLVEKDRDVRGRVRLVLVAPAETAELLGRITPSFPARLTDRFERLVDSLLEPRREE